MTAASSPPPRDGEVCTCGHFWRLHDAATEECFVWVQTEQGRAYCVCPSFRPAAPSEPPAADSPTPGTEAWVSPFPPFGTTPPPQPAAPSPVDTTEPPAETQQDDERARIAEEVASRYFERGDDELAQLRTDVYAALTGDFARPSADTEMLRQARELVDEYFGICTDWTRPMDGASVMLRIRAALDGSR